jgi:hypothetical protein
MKTLALLHPTLDVLRDNDGSNGQDSYTRPPSRYALCRQRWTLQRGKASEERNGSIEENDGELTSSLRLQRLLVCFGCSVCLVYRSRH